MSSTQDPALPPATGLVTLKQEQPKAKPRTIRISRIPKSISYKELERWLQGMVIAGNELIQVSMARYDENFCQATTTFRIVPSIFNDIEGAKTTEVDGPNGAQLLIDVHFTGMTVLYDPVHSSAEPAKADIIALPGLGGHALGSWKSPEGHKIWLRDFLPEVVKEVRILVYGYDTNLKAKPDWKTTIFELARSMLNNLKGVRGKDTQSRPLIFAGHSLGGLIIKQALITVANERKITVANERKIYKPYQDIFESCCSVIFFGVPNAGIRFEELMLTAKHQRNEDFVHGLLPDQDTDASPILSMLTNEFGRVERSFEKRRRKGLNILLCYETLGTEVKSSDGTLKKKVLVPQLSATHTGVQPKPHHVLALSGDHRSMVKFTDQVDVNYQSVSLKIQEFVEEATESQADEAVPTVLPTSHRITTQASYRPLTRPPYPKDSNFKGREEILRYIEKKNEKHPDKHRIVLQGEAGMGKTHIANEYAHRYADTHHARVFWISARTPEQFVRSYKQLAIQLSIPELTNPENDILDLVKGYLSEPIHGPWLMVIDGVDDLESMTWALEDRGVLGNDQSYQKQLMEYLPSSSSGFILMTTRDNTSATQLARRIDHIRPVPAFTREEGLSYLRKEDKEAEKLLEVLHRSPIALSQAVAYMTQRKENIPAYLKLLEKCSGQYGDLQSSRESIDAGIQTSQLSCEHFPRTDLSTSHLLYIISVFDLQTIPQFLLKKFGTGNFANSLHMLVEFKLVEIVTDSTPNPTQSVTMNPLVRFAVRRMATLKREVTLPVALALKLLSETFPPIERKEFRTCEILEPYAKAVLDHKDRPTSRVDNLCRATLLFNVGKFFHHMHHDNYKAALEPLKESLKLRETELPKSHPLLLETKKSVDELEQKMKNQKNGLSNVRKALLGSNTKQLPPISRWHSTLPKFADHLDAIRSVTESGKHEHLEKELLKLRQNLQDAGEDSDNHDELLGVDDGLAIYYQNSGQYEKAIAERQKVLDGCLKRYGPENIKTYRQIFGVGLSLDRLGDHAAAATKYLEALDGMQQSLGRSHPEVSRLLCNLATSYALQGRIEEADSTFREALEDQLKRPGPAHPDTLMTKHNYGVFLQGQEGGDLSIAERHLAESVKGRAETLGNDHPDTLSSAAHLAWNFYLRGKSTKALQYSQMILPRLEELLGEENTDTIAMKKAIQSMRAEVIDDR